MAEDKPTWTVVQFIDDGTVEAVPSSWVQKDECYWPTFPPQKLHMAIKKNEPLNTHWPSHKVKSFRKATYDDYFKARTKSKVAEDTSELNTDSDSEAKKRKRIQRILSSSGSGDELEETLLPMAPKVIRKKTDIKVQKKEAYENALEEENNGSYIELNADCVPAGGSTKDNPVRVPAEMEYLSQSGPHKEKLCGCQNCTKTDKTLNSLIQQGHILRGLITDTLSEVKNLRKDLDLINLQKPNQTNMFNNAAVKFPIEKDEDFDIIEDMLQNEEEFNKAIPELSKLGGGSVYDYIRRVFGIIMTDEYAIKFSWLGRKGKRRFNNSNLARLILRSADATGLPKTRKDVEVAIQNWLRRATDRRHFAQTKKKF